MKIFLAISIGLHALLFAALSLAPARKGKRGCDRVIEVSYYQGRRPIPVKKTKPPALKTAPIVKAEIKTVKEELKTPEESVDNSYSEKKESSGLSKTGTDETGDGGGYSDTDSEIAAWFSAFKERIERFKRYPKKALEEGSEGKTLLEITVEGSGIVNKIKVFYSSGDDALDNEAVCTVRAASPFRPLPEKMGKTVVFRLPLKFEVRK
ncbi:MAG: energy transducer TonB [Candidatus Firestonebacteria bacterium]